MTKRILWIDVAKGIGIITIIYGHGLTGDTIRYLFYSFHIPLFFFLSGVVFRHKNHGDLVEAIKKTLKGVLIPYFIFALMSYGVWLVLNRPQDPLFIKALTGILYGNGNDRQLFINVSLWFLPCLFATRLIFTFITLKSTKASFLLPTLFVFSGIGYSLSQLYPDATLPLGLETAFTATVFFGLGYLLYHKQPLVTLIQRYKYRVFFVCFMVGISLATWNYNLSGHQIDMRLNRLDNYFLFYGAALSGIGATLTLSFIFEKNRLLALLGQNSLILFTWHLIVFSLISKILLLFITGDTINRLRNLYFAPLYSMLAISAILGVKQMYRPVQKTFKSLI